MSLPATATATNGLSASGGQVSLGGTLTQPATTVDVNTRSLSFANGAANALSIAAGNVAVDGPLKISSGSPGAGKVLVSDAAGNATWGTAAAGVISASNGLTNTSGNISLGGSLSQNTTLALGSNSLTLGTAGAAVGIFSVSPGSTASVSPTSASSPNWQSFTTTAALAPTAAAFLVNGTGSTASTFTLELRAGTGPAGTLLGSVGSGSVTSATPAFVQVPLSGVSLASGQVYSLVLRVTSASAVTLALGNDSYAGGTAGQSASTPYTGFDFNVQLFGPGPGAGLVIAPTGITSDLSLRLPQGATVNEFSTDGTLAGNADSAVPTERAVKTYVDARTATTPGDNLGNHAATQELRLGFNKLSGGTAAAPGTSWLQLYNAPLATASAQTSPLMRLERNTTSGVKYSNVAEWALGSYGTAIGAQTRLDLNLNDGNTQNPDRTVMTMYGDGEVRVDGRLGMGYKIDNNILIGFGSGNSLVPNLSTSPQQGVANVFLGVASGNANVAGRENTFLGYNAGKENTSSNNTFVGSGAGYVSTTGDNNTMVGQATGAQTTTGQSNTFIGLNAGLSNVTGSGNTMLGNSADMGFANLTNATAIGFRAYVENNNTLVLGGVNGKNGATNPTFVGIGTTAPTSFLEVGGSVAAPFDSGVGPGSGTGVLLGNGAFTYRRNGTAITSIGLPRANTCPGRMYNLINGSGLNAVPLRVGGSLATTGASGANNTIYDDLINNWVTSMGSGTRLTLQSDGSTWIVISRN